MASPTSTVKSKARVERARALIAALPRDPLTGRILPRSAAPVSPPAPPETPPPPAGGPAGAPPFGQAPRGLRRFRRRSR